MQSNYKMLTTNDLMEKSMQSLQSDVFDFISGGAGNEWGLSNNINAFQRYQIVPRVLQKTETIDTKVYLFGKEFSNPIMIAPCAFHKLACKEGELATCRAAAKTNTIFTLSTMSSFSIEEVASASTSEKWFQLYVYKNKKITQDLIKRAENSGYTALVITVDLPAMGMRMRDIKNKFSLPASVEAANFLSVGLSSISEKSDGSRVKEHTDQQFEANLGWDSIDWLCSVTRLPVLLKGILNAEDAIEAQHHKIAGIIVSNHGGRQIDNVISPLDALPEIARAVNNKLPLIVDGGIRSGEDVFKAVALGATAVMIGRPVLWALSVGGEEELSGLLSRLQNELSLTMRLAGCNSLQIIRERGLSLLSSETIFSQKLLEIFKSRNINTQEETAKNIPHSSFFRKSAL